MQDYTIYAVTYACDGQLYLHTQNVGELYYNLVIIILTLAFLTGDLLLHKAVVSQ